MPTIEQPRSRFAATAPRRQEPGRKRWTRTGKWKDVFLLRLATTGSVSAAILAAGVSRATPYAHRKTDEGFAAGWDQALDEASESWQSSARE